MPRQEYFLNFFVMMVCVYKSGDMHGQDHFTRGDEARFDTSCTVVDRADLFVPRCAEQKIFRLVVKHVCERIGELEHSGARRVLHVPLSHGAIVRD